MRMDTEYNCTYSSRFLPLKSKALDWAATVYGSRQAKWRLYFVESETGKGTTFRIYLPRVSQSRGTN